MSIAPTYLPPADHPIADALNAIDKMLPMVERGRYDYAADGCWRVLEAYGRYRHVPPRASGPIHGHVPGSEVTARAVERVADACAGALEAEGIEGDTHAQFEWLRKAICAAWGSDEAPELRFERHRVLSILLAVRSALAPPTAA